MNSSWKPSLKVRLVEVPDGWQVPGEAVTGVDRPRTFVEHYHSAKRRIAAVTAFLLCLDSAR
jgi:hypothetical protein